MAVATARAPSSTRWRCALPRLRVLHLAANGGKANALNIGAMLARHERLLCIDGAALLDRLQLGEFSSIIGLVRRVQTACGRLCPVSWVIAGFRRQALHDAGWWSSHMLTDDIDISWRIQLAGWRAAHVPGVRRWIPMPETLRRLWRQRVRWAAGDVQMLLDDRAPCCADTRATCSRSGSTISSWCSRRSACSLTLLVLAGVSCPAHVTHVSLLPHWWGAVLALTFHAQALVSHAIERCQEPDMLRSPVRVISYPLAFWLVSMFIKPFPCS